MLSGVIIKEMLKCLHWVDCTVNSTLPKCVPEWKIDNYNGKFKINVVCNDILYITEPDLKGEKHEHTEI